MALVVPQSRTRSDVHVDLRFKVPLPPLSRIDINLPGFFLEQDPSCSADTCPATSLEVTGESGSFFRHNPPPPCETGAIPVVVGCGWSIFDAGIFSDGSCHTIMCPSGGNHTAALFRRCGTPVSTAYGSSSVFQDHKDLRQSVILLKDMQAEPHTILTKEVAVVVVPVV